MKFAKRITHITKSPCRFMALRHQIPKMIEPKPYKPRRVKYPVAVIDFETDPFQYGRIPKPFACGWFDGAEYVDFWGQDCVAQLVAFMRQKPRHIVYAHNGGHFDFHLMLEHVEPDQRPHIIKGRMVSIEIAGHECRDSFAILPVPLAKFGQKLEIAYSKMEADKREENRAEIMDYLRQDCVALHRVVTYFLETFGDAMTIGNIAMRRLNHFHGFERLNETQDRQLRNFYYGGRVQCFETGVKTGKFSLYDVNSMYPKAMAAFRHPVGGVYEMRRKITARTCFALVKAKNRGALPFRTPEGKLTFEHAKGEFFATIHEIEAGLETGTLDVQKVIYTIDFAEQSNFAEFIEGTYAERLNAKAVGDTMLVEFFKLVMNSSYGRFALDPRKFDRYFISDLADPPGETFDPIERPHGWLSEAHIGERVMWRQPTPKVRSSAFINVATAASITGAARAMLWRGICQSTRPLYCDTDSIICESFGGDIDPSRLGAWKLEKEADKVAVAGKKLYAMFAAGECVKKASKGVQLSGEQIEKIAAGDTIEVTRDAPKFKFNGAHIFVKRKISRTGNAIETDSDDDGDMVSGEV